MPDIFYSGHPQCRIPSISDTLNFRILSSKLSQKITNADLKFHKDLQCELRLDDLKINGANKGMDRLEESQSTDESIKYK